LRVLALSASVVACRADEPPAAEKQPEAAAENKPVVDQKIASAMAAAQRDTAPSGAEHGQPAPPADGVLGVEAAARELAPGSAAQLVLGADGSSPKLSLGPAHLAAGTGPSGVLQLSLRTGGSVMPTIDFELKLKTSAAPAGAATVASHEAAPAPGGASSAASAEGSVVTRFALVSARPAAQQPGRLPDEARAEIAKLKGSSIEFVTGPHGAVQSQRYQAAGNSRDLEPFVQSSAQALSSLALPYPAVPVGVGAFWMVKSREPVQGAEAMVYRMVKVTGLKGDVAELTVNTRRYLITPSLQLQGLPPHRVRQFQSEGDATLSVRAGSTYPSSAQLKDRFMALVVPEESPTQGMPVQSELSATLTLAP
jgi:hypothetical protein